MGKPWASRGGTLTSDADDPSPPPRPGLSRRATLTGTAKSNMFDNRPTETQYFYTDNDGTGAPLDGNHGYSVTFAPGQEPPVQGFWSLTLYNDRHLFRPNDLKRYSLGTKNKDPKRNPDGSLTLYAGGRIRVRTVNPIGCQHLPDLSRSTSARTGAKIRSPTAPWQPPAIQPA